MLIRRSANRGYELIIIWLYISTHRIWLITCGDMIRSLDYNSCNINHSPRPLQSEIRDITAPTTVIYEGKLNRAHTVRISRSLFTFSSIGNTLTDFTITSIHLHAKLSLPFLGKTEYKIQEHILNTNPRRHIFFEIVLSIASGAKKNLVLKRTKYNEMRASILIDASKCSLAPNKAYCTMISSINSMEGNNAIAPVPTPMTLSQFTRIYQTKEHNMYIRNTASPETICINSKKIYGECILVGTSYERAVNVQMEHGQ